MRRDVVERVRRRLAVDGAGVSAAAVAEAVRAESGGVAGHADVLDAMRYLRKELVGLGPLEELIAEPGVTDVLVTGPEQVWVDGSSGLRQVALRFDDEAAVRRLAQRLAGAAGRRLDDAQPYVDGWLPGAGPHGRVRLHAVLPPVAADGTCISLRLLRTATYDLDALVARGALDEAAVRVLRAIVRARLAFLITGGTGSGKTTLLGALLAAVPAVERIVSVEDALELGPRHPQFVRLVARPPNVEGAGDVTLRDLVRQALRMRPDRLVVGEVRGSEVVEMLSALNTGHDGGAATLHANAPAEVPARLEGLAALGGLSRDGLHSQLAAAVQVVLHMRRESSGARSLSEIAVLRRVDSRVTAVPVWERGEWTADQRQLADLLTSREVRPPWQ